MGGFKTENQPETCGSVKIGGCMVVVGGRNRGLILRRRRAFTGKKSIDLMPGAIHSRELHPWFYAVGSLPEIAAFGMRNLFPFTHILTKNTICPRVI